MIPVASCLHGERNLYSMYFFVFRSHLLGWVGGLPRACVPFLLAQANVRWLFEWWLEVRVIRKDSLFFVCLSCEGRKQYHGKSTGVPQEGLSPW